MIKAEATAATREDMVSALASLATAIQNYPDAPAWTIAALDRSAFAEVVPDEDTEDVAA